MTWLAWRQQRTEFVIGLGLLAILLAVFIPTGIRMANSYDDAAIGDCLAAPTEACGATIDAFFDRFEAIQGVTSWFGLLPVLIGILFAAPLLLELERGTYRLAWTQSISRERWIVAKLLVISASAVLLSLAITLLFFWWRQPLDRIEGRIDPGPFQIEGPAPVAYALFATTLIIALGSVLRRAVAAIGLGVVLFLVLRIGIETWGRPNFQTPLKTTTDRASDPLRSGWILSDTSGPAGTVTTYQPDSRFWTFQAIETGIFVLLSVLCLVIAYSAIQRRAR